MITNISINNFKCFSNQSFNLKPLTLLTGFNSTGKSSVIQTLLLLRQSYLRGNGKVQKLVLNGEYTSVGTGYDALYQNADSEKISFSIETQKQFKTTWTWGYEKELDLLPLKQLSGSEDVYRSHLFSNQFHYLASERIGPKNFFETSQYLVKHHRQLGSKGEFTAHYLSTYGNEIVQYNNLLHPKAESNILLHQVNAWLGEIRPGTRISLVEHTEMDLINLRYDFKGKGEFSNKFRPINVGYGLTNILPILTAILSAQPGTILLLENPEAHIHPKGQTTLGHLLACAAANGIQLIIETHSDHIINGIRLATYQNKISPKDTSINFFQPIIDDDSFASEVLNPQLDSNGRLDYWPDGFFDEWDKMLFKLIQPKGE